jgi:hypothetical protein
MPVFAGNACGTDYIRKVQKHGVIMRTAGEDFNVATIRPHWGAADSEVSDVIDEASVPDVDQ